MFGNNRSETEGRLKTQSYDQWFVLWSVDNMINELTRHGWLWPCKTHRSKPNQLSLHRPIIGESVTFTEPNIRRTNRINLSKKLLSLCLIYVDGVSIIVKKVNKACDGFVSPSLSNSDQTTQFGLSWRWINMISVCYLLLSICFYWLYTYFINYFRLSPKKRVKSIDISSW